MAFGTALTTHTRAQRLARENSDDVYRIYRVEAAGHSAEGWVTHGYTERLTDAIEASFVVAYHASASDKARILEWRSTEPDAGWVVIREVSLSVVNVDPRLAP